LHLNFVEKKNYLLGMRDNLSRDLAPVKRNHKAKRELSTRGFCAFIMSRLVTIWQKWMSRNLVLQESEIRSVAVSLTLQVSSRTKIMPEETCLFLLAFPARFPVHGLALTFDVNWYIVHLTENNTVIIVQ